MNQKIYALDTNIILQDVKNLERLSENKKNILAIPETVLVELEDKKKLVNELGYFSRQFSRILNSLTTISIEKSDKGCTLVTKENENYKIIIIAKNEYICANSSFDLSELNDKKIIEAVKCLINLNKQYDVKFLSLDNFCRTFAEIEDISTETLNDDKDEVPEFEFVKNIKLESNYFNSIDSKAILDFDKDNKAENFNYTFSSSDGNKTYAIISNGRIDILDENDFNTMNIKPVNLKQKLLTKAIVSDNYEVVVVDAKAGSGKTLMALSSAMKLIDIKKDKYQRIIYIRNSIESIDKGADIGYLSGNDEKFKIYNHPLYDNLNFIAKKLLSKKSIKDEKDTLEKRSEELISKYQIETMWVGEMRGRTLSGAIVIMDEWANSSNNTTQLMLSRLDNTCKAIVIGSNRQIDNIYLNKFNNGLTQLLKETRKNHDELRMYAIDLDQAVRGDFANFSEKIFENKSNS